MANPSLVSQMRSTYARRVVNSFRDRGIDSSRDRSSLTGRRLLLIPCLIALTLPACAPKPSAVTPSIVGVVTSIEVRQSADPLVHLANGRAFDMTGAEALLGGMPFHGELLVAGGEGESRWYYAATSSAGHPFDAPDCPFTISASDIWEEANAVVFGFGVRLPKDANYLRPTPEKEMYSRAIFCVDADGEVTKALSYEPH